MAYFGGRLLNTKINPDLSTGIDNIDDVKVGDILEFYTIKEEKKFI